MTVARPASRRVTVLFLHDLARYIDPAAACRTIGPSFDAP